MFLVSQKFLFFLGWEGPKFTRSRAGGPKGLKQQAGKRATFCALSFQASWDNLGTRKDKNMKLGKNNFVVTFKTEDEVVEYMNRHIPEERRLLWLGFFIANNYIAQRLEDEGVSLLQQSNLPKKK